MIRKSFGLIISIILLSCFYFLSCSKGDSSTYPQYRATREGIYVNFEHNSLILDAIEKIRVVAVSEKCNKDTKNHIIRLGPEEADTDIKNLGFNNSADNYVDIVKESYVYLPKKCFNYEITVGYWCSDYKDKEGNSFKAGLCFKGSVHQNGEHKPLGVKYLLDRQPGWENFAKGKEIANESTARTLAQMFGETCFEKDTEDPSKYKIFTKDGSYYIPLTKSCRYEKNVKANIRSMDLGPEETGYRSSFISNNKIAIKDIFADQEAFTNFKNSFGSHNLIQILDKSEKNLTPDKIQEILSDGVKWDSDSEINVITVPDTFTEDAELDVTTVSFYMVGAV